MQHTAQYKANHKQNQGQAHRFLPLQDKQKKDKTKLKPIIYEKIYFIFDVIVPYCGRNGAIGER